MKSYIKTYFRDIYEEIIGTFQTNGKFWKAYIEHEMKMGNHERVEKLFQRSLIKVIFDIFFKNLKLCSMTLL